MSYGYSTGRALVNASQARGCVCMKDWETSAGGIHAGGFCGLQRRPSVRESVAVREGKDSIFLQLWWTRGGVKRSDGKLTGSGDGKKR